MILCILTQIYKHTLDFVVYFLKFCTNHCLNSAQDIIPVKVFKHPHRMGKNNLAAKSIYCNTLTFTLILGPESGGGECHSSNRKKNRPSPVVLKHGSVCYPQFKHIKVGFKYIRMLSLSLSLDPVGHGEGRNGRTTFHSTGDHDRVLAPNYAHVNHILVLYGDFFSSDKKKLEGRKNQFSTFPKICPALAGGRKSFSHLLVVWGKS